MADFTDYVVLDDVADALEYADSGIELAPVDWVDMVVLDFSDTQIDPTPPVITNVLPAVQSDLLPDHAVQFDITRAGGGILKAIIWARFEDTGAVDLVYDGVSFQPLYVMSNATPIQDGTRFVVRKVGGWPSRPTIQGTAFGPQGQELV